MGVWTDNPVLAREVRGRLRWKRKGAGRAGRWVAGTIGLVFIYFYGRGLIGIAGSTAQDAREFWPLVAYGALALIVLLTPALAATAITQEREQQTWETLATTQLSASDVLLGKWLGRQIIPWLVLAFVTPFLLVCIGRGGMGFWLLPATLIFFVVTTGFYCALGLLCSFLTKRTAGATATALTLTALLCIGTVIVSSVMALLLPHSGSENEPGIMWVNPFFALTSLMSWLDLSGGQAYSSRDVSTSVLVTLVYLSATLLATAAALRFMVLRYRQAVQG